MNIHHESHSDITRFICITSCLLALCICAIPSQAAVKLDVPSSNTFTQDSVNYYGLEFLLHVPNEGNVWIAIPANHDLEVGPVTPLVVLHQGGEDPFAGEQQQERPSISALQEQINQMREEMFNLRHDSRIALRPAQPFLGEIRLYGGNTEVPGWINCDGRLLLIGQYQELFAVLGNAYGGDGRVTFGVPDLRGRSPMGAGAGAGLTNRKVGDEPGAEAVILDVTQLPAHDHTLRATNSSATQTQPAGKVLATAATPQYLNASTSVNMGTDSIGATGSNAPHSNVQPNAVLRFMIAAHPDYARTRYPNAAKWPVQLGSASPQYKVKNVGGGSVVTLEPDYDYGVNLVWEIYTSGGVDYIGLDIIEHEDGIGLIWFSMPRIHNLMVTPVTPVITLSPGNFPIPGTDPTGDGLTTVGIGDDLYAIREIVDDFRLKGWGQSAEFNYNTRGRSTTVDQHSGLEFTSAAVDYLGLEMLQHEDGVGTIWVAVHKNHDLDVGPVTPVIVLAPDVVTPR